MESVINYFYSYFIYLLWFHEKYILIKLKLGTYYLPIYLMFYDKRNPVFFNYFAFNLIKGSTEYNKEQCNILIHIKISIYLLYIIDVSDK